MEKNVRVSDIIKKRIKNPKKLFYSILSAVLIVTMLGSGGYLLYNFYLDRRSGKEFDEIQEIVNNTTGNNTGNSGNSSQDEVLDEDTENKDDGGSKGEDGGFIGAKYEILTVNGVELQIPVKNMDWDAIHAMNEDIYAWIYVPGTDVDYPVLQHPTENDYYLHKNFAGEYSLDGNIYTQVEYNSKDFTDYHTALYGHNRRSNGKMFRTLHNFQNRNFFDEYPYFYIYTEKGVYVYEIFAAYRTTSEHQIANYPISTYEGLLEYVEMAMERTTHTGYKRTIPEDEHLGRIMTLSTCVGDDPSVRFLVQAFLVYEPTAE